MSIIIIQVADNLSFEYRHDCCFDIQFTRDPDRPPEVLELARQAAVDSRRAQTRKLARRGPE